MKEHFDRMSLRCSELITQSYSTSFSIGIYLLHKRFRSPIYAIYGFVRCADEIVDSFHGYDREKLLSRFREDTYEAIEDRISLNPVLNSFQHAVHQYHIERELIDCFLDSMKLDLADRKYDTKSYEKYILGSAEVVGLMCLRVFTENNNNQYNHLRHYAMKLGAAFQKVNFLRDLKSDYRILGRTYFPQVEVQSFSWEDKQRIEMEIAGEFIIAHEGITKLPSGARLGVYVAYMYYRSLFKKISNATPKDLLNDRIRISNRKKMLLMLNSFLLHKLNRI